MTVIEENALATRTEQTFELSPTAASAEKQFEIQSAIIIARRFPRSEDQAFEKLMRACRRLSFAEDAAYAFPRGDQKVEGPSVNLAREAARVWGNFRHGLEVIRDDDESRQIRAFAWDLETNEKVTAEDEFQKLIYRKKGGWQKPDERDLRELTNRRGAILKRNCILEVLPKDLIEDALARCKETIKEGAASDPETTRKRLILAFSELNITPEMLEQKLGHPLGQCSPTELADLRTIYKSIADGNSTWAEYVAHATNGDEPRRKSENTTGTQVVEQPATPASAPAGTGESTPAGPFDTKRPYKVIEVIAARKKGDSFTVSVEGGDKKPIHLLCNDQRLYIAATSAKQTNADVIVAAHASGDVLMLTAIEQLA